MPFDGSQLDGVTKLLIEGRERIEQGWCQGRARERGAVCMIGAIHTGEFDMFNAAAMRLSWVVGDDLLPVWNDAPGRTKDEVLAAFDRAIALEWAG